MRLYSADIYVHDLDGAIVFYVDRLGFEKRVDVPVDDKGHRWVEVAPPGSETAMILSQGFGT
jgi:catechol 2,3-dioxygenase-like lactoylglutathione lyase family enzyme